MSHCCPLREFWTPTLSRTRCPADAQLLVFALTECKAFFGKLATTIQTAAEEGKHPATLLKGEKKAGTGTPKVFFADPLFNLHG